MYSNITFLKVPFLWKLLFLKKTGYFLERHQALGPHGVKKIKKQLPSKAYSRIVVPPKRRGGEM